MSIRRYSSYLTAETELCLRIINEPHFRTKTTYERWNEGFVLTEPRMNQNARSNYAYAEEFFKWLMTGDTNLSEALLKHNPWVKRFVDNTGLPESFSSTYGQKIKMQYDVVMEELKRNPETRRAYINILTPLDHVILPVKTTHEYPCTIGLQFFIREMKLYLMVNMRSNNCLSVMPYDVYNFTELQIHVARELGYELGEYIHQINNAHVYKGDARRVLGERV